MLLLAPIMESKNCVEVVDDSGKSHVAKWIRRHLALLNENKSSRSPYVTLRFVLSAPLVPTDVVYVSHIQRNCFFFSPELVSVRLHSFIAKYPSECLVWNGTL